MLKTSPEKNTNQVLVI